MIRALFGAEDQGWTMRKEDFRAGAEAGWTEEFIDSILHAKRVRSLSDAVQSVWSS